MPRDVMPVFGRTPYKGPGKRGFTPPPPKTPSTTPVRRRTGGRPASRSTSRWGSTSKTPAVIPTPTIAQQGKGIISSVDKGNTKGDTSQETIQETIQNTISNNTGGDQNIIKEGFTVEETPVEEPTTPKTTPSDETSRSRQPRGDWWWSRRMNRNDIKRDPYTGEVLLSREEKSKLYNEYLQWQHAQTMEGMPDYWNRGQAQYASHDPSRYHGLGADVTGERLDELLSSGLGAFYLPFNSPFGPLAQGNIESEHGVRFPEEGIQAGHSYAMPGLTSGTWPGLEGGMQRQDPLRHETVHDVHSRTDSLLQDIKYKIMRGEDSSQAHHPWGEVEKTILDLFPDDLNESMRSIDAAMNVDSIIGAPKYDMEELLTRVEDTKSGDKEMREWAQSTIDQQVQMAHFDVTLFKDNIETLEQAVDDFYNNRTKSGGLINTGQGAVNIVGGDSINRNAIESLERALASEQEKLTLTEARVKGLGRIEEYHSAQNKALASYHKAGGNLESLSSSYEKVRFPGTYDESWQQGTPYLSGLSGR